MEQFFQEFCDNVIAVDSSIRFIGIADGHGRLLATSERKGLKPLLNEEETAQYAITAATRQYTRIRWQPLLVKLIILALIMINCFEQLFLLLTRTIIFVI